MGAVLSIVAGVALIITGSIIAAVVINKRKKMNQEQKDPAKQVSVYGYWPVITSFVGIGLGVLLTILGSILAARDAKRKRLRAAQQVAVTVQSRAPAPVAMAAPAPVAVVAAPVAAPAPAPAPPAAVTVEVAPPAAIRPAAQPVRV